MIGRLAAYGLAAASEAGVRRIYQLVREEMQTVLTLLGVGSVRDLGPDFLGPNQRSTWLVQNEPVGVDCRWKRG